jgi:hypothetical protein
LFFHNLAFVVISTQKEFQKQMQARIQITGICRFVVKRLFQKVSNTLLTAVPVNFILVTFAVQKKIKILSNG